MRVIDPMSVQVAANRFLAYGFRGDIDAAMSEAIRGEPLINGSRTVCRGARFSFVALASHDESLIERFLAAPIEDRSSIDVTNVSQIGLAYLDAPDKAPSLLRRATSSPNPPTIPLATWANFFGDAELALKAFRRASTEIQVVVSWQLWLPFFAEMRRLPGFKDLVRDLGLADCWRDSGNWADFCQPLGDFDFECG